VKWFEKDLEIRYVDTDAMGVVHHSVFPVYCEACRIQMLDDIELPYTELEAAGYYLMVSEFHCRYRAPIRFGDRVFVRTKVTLLKKRLLVFAYELRRRDDNKLLFTGSSKHLVTHKTDAVVSLPDVYLEKMRAGLTDDPDGMGASQVF